MVVYCVQVYVKEGYADRFLAATENNHLATRQEPGNIRFDVLQNHEDPNLFFLYEIYQSNDAVKAHKETEHYLKWREEVASWMAKPREGVEYKPCFPEDRGSW